MLYLFTLALAGIVFLFAIVIRNMSQDAQRVHFGATIALMLLLLWHVSILGDLIILGVYIAAVLILLSILPFIWNKVF